MGHLVELWTGVVSNPVSISEAEAIAAYSQITGYNSATGANDTGMTIGVGFNYFANTGLAGHRCREFRKSFLDARSKFAPLLLKRGIDQLGAVIIGLDLPSAAVGAWQAHLPWSGDMGPGQNGHCIPLVSYDSQGFEAITWGGLQRIDLPFLANYCFEIWGATGDDWVNGNTGVNPLGRTAASLSDDLAWVMTFDWVAV
jgi:hypothetical protein